MTARRIIWPLAFVLALTVIGVTIYGVLNYRRLVAAYYVSGIASTDPTAGAETRDLWLYYCDRVVGCGEVGLRELVQALEAEMEPARRKRLFLIRLMGQSLSRCFPRCIAKASHPIVPSLMRNRPLVGVLVLWHDLQLHKSGQRIPTNRRSVVAARMFGCQSRPRFSPSACPV